MELVFAFVAGIASTVAFLARRAQRRKVPPSRRLKERYERNP